MRARPAPAGARTAAEGARSAAEHLRATAAFVEARRVAAYVALPHELPTEPLFEIVVRSHKLLLLPRMDLVAGSLDFVPSAPGAELRVGRYGVREPAGGAPVALEAGDLVIVPGLAFDRRGGRLGHGGGWYDRTFSGPPRGERPRLFGFAYAAQIVDRVPHGPLDLRVEAIVTEGGVILVRGAGPAE